MSHESSYTFDLAAEMERAKSLPAAGGRASLPVVSYPSLKQLVIYMPEGSRWDEHSTPGRVSAQVLRGRVVFSFMDSQRELRAGNVLALDTSVRHSVEAMEESWFLLTVARCDGLA